MKARVRILKICKKGCHRLVKSAVVLTILELTL